MRPTIDPRPSHRATAPARARGLALSLLLLAALPAAAGEVELLSGGEDSGTSGNPEPFLVLPQTAISADGRYAAIAIGSFNLVAGQVDTNFDKDVFLFDRVTGTRTLVSHVAGSPAEAGSGFSPAISADGRWVAFLSGAPDLVPGQMDGAFADNDVFLWDRTSGDLVLVSHTPSSAGTAGGGGTEEVALSADGRFVAFVSAATDLVPGGSDGNSATDVFLWDRQTDATVLVSHASGSANTAAGGTSASVTISADGRYVAYRSDAANLVPGQSQPIVDNVYLYDRVAGTTTLVSHTAGTTTASHGERPIVSRDGGHVLFTSGAADLVPGQSGGGGFSHVFLWERASGTTVLVSRSAASPTVPGNDTSIGQAISADGAWVAFGSGATDLVPGQIDGGVSFDLFLYERATGATTLASHTTASPTTTTTTGFEQAALSGDGRFLAFSSAARDLVPGQVEAEDDADIFIFDRSSGAVALASHTPGSATTPANARSRGPTISADGAWIVFASLATDLVAGLADSNDNNDLFLHDRAAGTNDAITRSALPSATPLGASSALDDPLSAVSADGRFVAFLSDASHLVPGQVDANGGDDVFLRDRLAGTTTLVSHASASPLAAGGSTSDQPVVSADGRFVAFLSHATDLVPGQADANGQPDLFLFDRIAGTTVLVTHASGAPATAASGTSLWAAISADGRYVAFASSASNLVAGQAGAGPAVFLFDRVSGTSVLVSHAAASPTTVGNGPSNHPAVSDDGRFVAFDSEATNLSPGQADAGVDSDVFVWDRSTGTTTLASRAFDTPNGAALGPSFRPAISRDGAYVAFLSDAVDLVPGEVPSSGFPDVFLFDRAAGINMLVSHTAASASSGGGVDCPPVVSCTPPALSADGRFVAFTSPGADLVPGQVDAADSDDAFLFDRLSGAIVLASHASDSPATAAGNTRFHSPALSADGRFLAFTSSAGNLVPGQEGPLQPNVFVYDRLSGTNALASHVPGSASTSGDFLSLDPLLSGDGSVAIFTSVATDLVAGDRNDAADVFAYLNSAAVAPTGAFFTLAPCRLLDSREPGQGPAFVSGQAEVLTVKGNCGIPFSAKTLSLNVTVTQPTGPGHLTLYPGNLAPPFASTINFSAGQTRANNAVVSLATNGAGTLAIRPFLAGGGTVHVILDVTGYFE